jgi:hypothetical protein
MLFVSYFFITLTPCDLCTFFFYFMFIIFLKIALYGWFIKKNDPMQLLNWSFDWKYMVRGLVLDKKRGNILKVNSVHLFLAILLPNSA